MLRHVRRHTVSSQKSQMPPPAPGKDMRWHLLDLAKACRKRLTLRDRDIAVLRGLLTLLPPQAQAGQRVIFASNRVLIDRCDGIDERTLRRRIAHLQSCGMLERRTSPNGKRYQVRNEDHDALLTYGIDLSPLFQIQGHLEALAEECRRETIRIKALRSRLRDVLFNTPPSEITRLHANAQRALRRVLDSDQLQDILDQIKGTSPQCARQITSTLPVPTPPLSVNDGQNDRHIQRSDKYTLDSERNAETSTHTPYPSDSSAKTDKADITVDECMTLAKTAKAMAPAHPRCWEDVIELSTSLAPAIGLHQSSLHHAEKHLGRHGCALAVLGLVEAFGRIRNPAAYLTSLVQRGGKERLDLIRMFRSLVRPHRTSADLA